MIKKHFFCEGNFEIREWPKTEAITNAYNYGL